MKNGLYSGLQLMLVLLPLKSAMEMIQLVRISWLNACFLKEGVYIRMFYNAMSLSHGKYAALNK